jgi:thymidylate kinase
MHFMRNTKLILLEGISGSGKSSLAQFIAHTLTRQGIACRWWYEEEKEHPLYVFHDSASLQDTVDALSDDRYRQVIEAALEQWKVFVQTCSSSEKVVILDGCLFGYLTWSLFPLDISRDEIQAYLSQVEQIIQPLQPCLIYLYQQDIAYSLERICERRGNETRAWLMTQATRSAYGIRRGFQGFAGMVTYWQDFRDFVEPVFAQFDAAKLAIENSAGDWQRYEQSVLAFIGVPASEKRSIAPALLEPFAGTYCCEDEQGQHVCQILLEDGHLMVEGMPEVWPRTRLLPLSHHSFAVVSLPFQIAFEEDIHRGIIGLKATGPELLFGTVERFFVRVQEP